MLNCQVHVVDLVILMLRSWCQHIIRVQWNCNNGRIYVYRILAYCCFVSSSATIWHNMVNKNEYILSDQLATHFCNVFHIGQTFCSPGSTFLCPRPGIFHKQSVCITRAIAVDSRRRDQGDL